MSTTCASSNTLAIILSKGTLTFAVSRIALFRLLSWLFWRLGLALPHIVVSRPALRSLPSSALIDPTTIFSIPPKAGENLNLPIVGPLLRRGGALYIRRSWGDDPLYPTVAKWVNSCIPVKDFPSADPSFSPLRSEYMSTLIEKGFNLEVFLEGTRSRSGKVLSPKVRARSPSALRPCLQLTNSPGSLLLSSACSRSSSTPCSQGGRATS